MGWRRARRRRRGGRRDNRRLDERFVRVTVRHAGANLREPAHEQARRSPLGPAVPRPWHRPRTGGDAGVGGVFRREKDKLFRHTWLKLARTEELPEVCSWKLKPVPTGLGWWHPHRGQRGRFPPPLVAAHGRKRGRSTAHQRRSRSGPWGTARTGNGALDAGQPPAHLAQSAAQVFRIRAPRRRRPGHCPSRERDKANP